MVLLVDPHMGWRVKICIMLGIRQEKKGDNGLVTASLVLFSFVVVARETEWIQGCGRVVRQCYCQ